MSVEAITWALRQPIKHSSAKFVLVVLANCANAEKAQAWPSIGYLATATGQDRKTVMANLQRLQDWGLIEDTEKRVGDTRQIVVYKLICGPDLFAPKVERVPKTEQYRKRDSTENGTVPFSPPNSPKNGTRNRQEPSTEEEEGARALSKFDRQQIAPYQKDLPPSIELPVFADFVKHRAVLRKPLSISAWRQVLIRLNAMHAEGIDLNASLRLTMEAGLAIPVDPRKQQAGADARAGPPRARVSDDFSGVNYGTGTPTNELPEHIRAGLDHQPA